VALSNLDPMVVTVTFTPEWFGMFTILIPVDACLLTPLRTAMAGD
jgi:predicted CDP-diglyceride synthetase/phosphatidate cytidylyltransferase